MTPTTPAVSIPATGETVKLPNVFVTPGIVLLGRIEALFNGKPSESRKP